MGGSEFDTILLVKHNTIQQKDVTSQMGMQIFFRSTDRIN